jgi:hypothetical protein
MLDPDEDKQTLAVAIERYASGAIELELLRHVADRIATRWQEAAEHEKPPFTSAEIPLWNAVWTITSGCKEELARDGMITYLQYLSGELPLPEGTAALRP